MSDLARIGHLIEEALDKQSDSELMAVLYSITPQEWAAVAKALQPQERKPSGWRRWIR